MIDNLMINSINSLNLSKRNHKIIYGYSKFGTKCSFKPVFSQNGAFNKVHES